MFSGRKSDTAAVAKHINSSFNLAWFLCVSVPKSTRWFGLKAASSRSRQQEKEQEEAGNLKKIHLMKPGQETEDVKQKAGNVVPSGRWGPPGRDPGKHEGRRNHRRKQGCWDIIIYFIYLSLFLWVSRLNANSVHLKISILTSALLFLLFLGWLRNWLAGSINTLRVTASVLQLI